MPYKSSLLIFIDKCKWKTKKKLFGREMLGIKIIRDVVSGKTPVNEKAEHKSIFILFPLIARGTKLDE